MQAPATHGVSRTGRGLNGEAGRSIRPLLPHTGGRDDDATTDVERARP